MRNGFVGFNVSLAAVDHWDITKAKRNDSASQNVYHVCSDVPA
jgi:hypothetical protein